MAKVVLYTYWRSSSAYRVRIALAFKNIAYEARPVNLLKDEQRAADYAKKSPFHVVPCLAIDDATFVESAAIIEMLEELHPEPALLPKSAADRAHVRALVQIINAGTQPLQNLVVLKRMPDDAAKKEWAQTFIARGLRAFDALMEAHDARTQTPSAYAFGDSFTMADAFLVPQMMNAHRYEVDLTDMPRAVRAHANALKHPAVIASLPEKQPDAPKT